MASDRRFDLHPASDREIKRRQAVAWVEILGGLAVEVYEKMPRTTTIALYAGKKGNSEIFCTRIRRSVDPKSNEDIVVEEKRVLLVPEQIHYIRKDPECGQFVCLKVIDPDQEDKLFWLVSSCSSRTGFLVSSDHFETRAEARS